MSTPSNTTPETGFDWRKIHAFGLPSGSIRAILGMIIFGSIWIWIVRFPGLEVPDYLQNLMFIILGHYFASRANPHPDLEAGPPPLFLPHGTIRFLILAGFIAVPILLHRRGELVVRHPNGDPQLQKGFVTLFLVGGFLLGVVIQKIQSWFSDGKLPSRRVEDIRALFSLTAALLFVLLLFNIVVPGDFEWLKKLESLAGKNGIKGILVAFIGFYFGSKS